MQSSRESISTEKRITDLNTANLSVDIIIPTYKPDAELEELVRRLCMQSIKPGKIIIVNTDEDEWKASHADELIMHATEGCRGICEVHHIKKDEFNHGYARNLAVGYSSAEYFICMTQDAMPADDRLIEFLVSSMDASIKMCYARQLPRKDSGEIEKITRAFNYPDESRIKNKEDLETLGIKTFFASNVCCAYERKTFDSLGGFIDKTYFNEDMMYASKLIRAGYSIKYCSEAQVYHSHDYTPKQLFERNYKLAISQAEHPEYFGDVKSESEGIRLVKTTAGTLVKNGKFYLVPELVFTSGVKYIGFRAGRIKGRR